MKKMLINTVIAVSVLLLAVNIFFYLQQPRMVFFPIKDIEQTPDQWGMPYEKVSLKSTHGNRITGWYIPGKEPGRALLFLHGNGGNMSHRGESLKIFHHLGLSVLIIDYQGYGESEGAPGEQALYDDGRAAFDYLVKDREFNKENIVVFGRSLGGAVAARITAEKQPGAAILESTFASVPDVAAYYFPVLSKFIVSRYRFNSLAQVKKIHCPLLVLHSKQDDVIPYPTGVKLYNAANNPRTFVQLVGDHNSGFLQSQPAYEDAIASFLKASGK